MSRVRNWLGNFIPSPGKYRMLRVVLLLMLIGCMIWAYDKHFERRLEEISATRDIVDPSKQLRPADKKSLKKLIAAYKQEYGIRVRLELCKEQGPLPENVPELPPQTLAVILGPEPGQSLVILPHLARKALPEEAEALYMERLSSCTRLSPLAACLERFLLALHNDLQQ